MRPTLGLGINFFNDALAMRGLLETCARWVDNIYCINSGPGGAYSTDGSIELAKSFGAKVTFADMDLGFGVIRTKLLHECGCTFCMILDCDERIFPQINVMTCEGNERYPDTSTPNLKVTVKPDIIDQAGHIRNLITNPATMAIRATRRHWFDYAMKKPAQNWYGQEGHKDHQLRILRNLPEIGYQRDRRMHERCLDSRTGRDPEYVSQDEHGGIFFDHFHLYDRTNRPGHKEKNEVNYSRLERGEKMIP